MQTEPINISAEFKVGLKDRQGREIRRIYVSSPEYVVYRTEDGIRVYVNDDHIAPSDRHSTRRFDDIGIELGRIYSLQPERLREVEAINRNIARAITQCLQGHLDAAKNLLSDAEARLIRLRRLQGRFQYLSGAFGLFFCASLAYLIAFYRGTPAEVLEVFCVAMFGGIGGFLSVASGVWTLDVDLDASSQLNAAAGASRIAIAIMGAIVAWLAIKADFLLGPFKQSSNAIYLAAVVAGFSEAFVPNIIRRVSDQPEKMRSLATQDKNSNVATIPGSLTTATDKTPT